MNQQEILAEFSKRKSNFVNSHYVSVNFTDCKSTFKDIFLDDLFQHFNSTASEYLNAGSQWLLTSNRVTSHSTDRIDV